MSQGTDFKKQHPLIAELTIEEILECAERWLALGKLPFVYENNARGFEDDRHEATDPRHEPELDEHPTYRRLDLMLETKVITQTRFGEQPPIARANVLSKLTEMADIVRARELEEVIRRSQH